MRFENIRFTYLHADKCGLWNLMLLAYIFHTKKELNEF